MNQVKIRPEVYVILASILWGTTGTTQAFAPSGTSPLAIGSLRMMVGGIVLFLIALYKGELKSAGDINKGFLILSSFSMAIFQPLFFSGVSQIGVAMGTVLTIGSSPVFSGLIQYIMGEQLTRTWYISTAISIVGCILLFGGQGNLSFNIIGCGLSLGAGLSYAIYVIATQRLLEHNSKERINALVFLITAVLLIPTLFIFDISWLTTIRGALVVFHLGVVTTALAYTLFSYGLVGIMASKAVTLTLAEPLTAAILGILLLKEQISIYSGMGIVLIFIGLLINAREE